MLVHAFNTLKDRKATVNQLIGAYLDFDRRLGEIKELHPPLRQKCVALKQMMMMGEDPGDYQKVRTELEEIGIETEVIQDAIQTIKSVLANRIPIENANRIEEAAAKLRETRTREKEETKKFLSMVGRAMAFKEVIFGRPKMVLPMSDGPKVCDDFPVPGIRSQSEVGVLHNAGFPRRQDIYMDDELEKHYLAEIQAGREELGIQADIVSIQEKERKLQNEIDKLSEAGKLDPQVAVEKSIQAARKALVQEELEAPTNS